MQEQLERDLKTALLAGDKEKLETLKGLKTALQYEAVSLKTKPGELSKEQEMAVLSREAKKRQDTADLYSRAGEAERAAKELAEKAIIQQYLPAPMSEEEVAKVVDEEIAKLENPTMQDMGRIIGAVRARTAGSAEGSLVARLVKQSLEQR